MVLGGVTQSNYTPKHVQQVKEAVKRKLPVLNKSYVLNTSNGIPDVLAHLQDPSFLLVDDNGADMDTDVPKSVTYQDFAVSSNTDFLAGTQWMGYVKDTKGTPQTILFNLHLTSESGNFVGEFNFTEEGQKARVTVRETCLQRLTTRDLTMVTRFTFPTAHLIMLSSIIHVP